MVLVDVFRSMISLVWGLFNGVTVPGTKFSFGDLFLSTFLIGISISIIQHGLGFGGNGSGYRSGSTNKPKISKERKGDTH